MSLLVLAYPELDLGDYKKIQNRRKAEDKLYYSVAEPHFTFVFPTTGFSENEFINEISKQAKKIKRFSFSIQGAIINKDTLTDYYHTFLVVDFGNSELIKLHDKLYSGKLKTNLNLDIDYIPHITVGNSKNKWECRAMADQWNKREFFIVGDIEKLTIANLKNNRLTTIKEIQLN